MKLRPHHILDIVAAFGHDAAFEPHPYGHAVHTVAKRILSDPDVGIELVVGADRICEPCKHLGPDGRCDDVLSQLETPVAKQDYNDDLDTRLLDYFGIEPGSATTVRAFLETVNRSVPGVERLCTHPKAAPDETLDGLVKGLAKLGIRQKAKGTP